MLVLLALLLLAGIAATVALVGAANGWLGAFPWSNPPLAVFYVLIAVFIWQTVKLGRESRR